MKYTPPSHEELEAFIHSLNTRYQGRNESYRDIIFFVNTLNDYIDSQMVTDPILLQKYKVALLIIVAEILERESSFLDPKGSLFHSGNDFYKIILEGLHITKDNTLLPPNEIYRIIYLNDLYEFLNHNLNSFESLIDQINCSLSRTSFATYWPTARTFIRKIKSFIEKNKATTTPTLLNNKPMFDAMVKQLYKTTRSYHRKKHESLRQFLEFVLRDCASDPTTDDLLTGIGLLLMKIIEGECGGFWWLVTSAENSSFYTSLQYALNLKKSTHCDVAYALHCLLQVEKYLNEVKAEALRNKMYKTVDQQHFLHLIDEIFPKLKAQIALLKNTESVLGNAAYYIAQSAFNTLMIKTISRHTGFLPAKIIEAIGIKGGMTLGRIILGPGGALVGAGVGYLVASSVPNAVNQSIAALIAPLSDAIGSAAKGLTEIVINLTQHGIELIFHTNDKSLDQQRINALLLDSELIEALYETFNDTENEKEILERIAHIRPKEQRTSEEVNLEVKSKEEYYPAYVAATSKQQHPGKQPNLQPKTKERPYDEQPPGYHIAKLY